jgi:hypothetical protein
VAKISLCFGGTHCLHLQRLKWQEWVRGGWYKDFIDRKIYWFL